MKSKTVIINKTKTSKSLKEIQEMDIKKRWTGKVGNVILTSFWWRMFDVLYKIQK